MRGFSLINKVNKQDDRAWFPFIRNATVRVDKKKYKWFEALDCFI